MRRAAFVLVLMLAGNAPADKIVFKDKLELAGDDVWIVEDDRESVTVRLDYGELKIAKSRIKDVEINYETHKENLVRQGKDDPSTLYKLGVLCENYGLTNEALDAYESALERDKTKPISEDLLVKLADRFEKHQKYESAYLALQTLKERNPGRQDVSERLTKLGEKLGKAKLPEVRTQPVAAVKPAETAKPGEPAKPTEAAQPVEPVKPTEAAKPAEPAKPTEGKPEIAVEEAGWLEGLESNPGWFVDGANATPPWANKATCEIKVQGEEVKNKILRVEFLGAEKDKTAVKLILNNLDLSQKKYLTMDIYNASDKVLQAVIALVTQPGWQWFESQGRTLKPKEWTRDITFDLTRPNFKCAPTWKFKSEIANRNQVSALALLLYDNPAQGAVFFDNIFFRTEEELKTKK